MCFCWSCNVYNVCVFVEVLYFGCWYFVMLFKIMSASLLHKPQIPIPWNNLVFIHISHMWLLLEFSASKQWFRDLGSFPFLDPLTLNVAPKVVLQIFTAASKRGKGPRESHLKSFYGLLWFYINFWTICFSSVKYIIGILMGIASNL